MIPTDIWATLEIVSYFLLVLIVFWVIKSSSPNSNKLAIVALVLIFALYAVSQAYSEFIAQQYPLFIAKLIAGLLVVLFALVVLVGSLTISSVNRNSTSLNY